MENKYPMSVETRFSLIQLIDDMHFLVDTLVEQEVVKPTKEIQIIRRSMRELKYDLCEPIRNTATRVIKKIKEDKKKDDPSSN